MFVYLWISKQSKTKWILLNSHVFVFVAVGVGRSGRQEHSVCLGLEERTSPRHGNRTLRQSTTLRSFTLTLYVQAFGAETQVTAFNPH